METPITVQQGHYTIQSAEASAFVVYRSGRVLNWTENSTLRRTWPTASPHPDRTLPRSARAARRADPGRSDVTALVVLILTLMADQATKGLVTRTMSPGQSIPDEGIVRATYVVNSGSAFGLFPDQTLFLTFASLVGIGVLLFFYRTHPVDSFMLRLSLGLMLGGAMGNLIDRVRLGHVVDFIDVGAWPVFNLADSAIVVGLIGLMWIVTSARYGQRAPDEPAPTAAFTSAESDWTEQAPDAWFDDYNDHIDGVATVQADLLRPRREEAWE